MAQTKLQKKREHIAQIIDDMIGKGTQSATQLRATNRRVEKRKRGQPWYHVLPKGWDCPGHSNDYKSTSCAGARYAG